MEDEWAMAFNRFTSAVHAALGDGMTEDEIQEAMDEAFASR